MNGSLYNGKAEPFIVDGVPRRLTPIQLRKEVLSGVVSSVVSCNGNVVAEFFPIQKKEGIKMALEWNETELNLPEGKVKAHHAVGPDTGTDYLVVPGTGNKWNLTADGNKVPGKRGTITAMKAEAEKLEAALILPRSDKPEGEQTPDPTAPAPPTATGTVESTEQKQEPAEKSVPTEQPSTEPAKPASPTVQEWVEETRKLSPESPQTADKGQGESESTQSPVFTPEEDLMILKLAENPENGGDPEENSWVSEVAKRPTESLTLQGLAKRGFVVIDGVIGQYYCHLTDKGLERYDQLNIEKTMAEKPKTKTKDKGEACSYVDQETGETVLVPVKIAGLPVGTVVRFPETGEKGTIRKKADHEITVDMEKSGRPNYFTPTCKVEVVKMGKAKEKVTLVPTGVKNFPELAFVEVVETPKEKAKVRLTIDPKKRKLVKAEPVKPKHVPGAVREKFTRHGIDVVIREPKEDGGKQRVKIMGIAVTAILRWMGADAWTLKEVKKALKALKLEIGEQTILSQWYSGRSPNGKRGDIPELTRKQSKLLDALKD